MKESVMYEVYEYDFGGQGYNNQKNLVMISPHYDLAVECAKKIDEEDSWFHAEIHKVRTITETEKICY